MAAKYTNGAYKGAKGMNGTNGINGMNGMNGINGMNGTNGHVVTPRRNSPAPERRGFFASALSMIARLLTWYSILTLLFRCPATLDACTDASPKICQPYFHAKQIISPHVTPYYDAYAAPYVDKARPYYDTLDRFVVTPSRTYAVKYGGPRLTQVQSLSQRQWDENVHPQIEKYQALAKERYDHAVSPHVEKASAALSPYYDIARTNALQTYHDLLLPAYFAVQPYAVQGYGAAYAFTANTAIPSSVWAWNKSYAFLDATIWPHLRDVYVMKVEPQLVRIGERLGRYKEQKPKQTAEEVDASTPASTFVKPSFSTMPSSTADAETVLEFEPSSTPVAEATSTEAAADTPAESKKAKKDPRETREIAAKTVAEDLELWEGKFTKAADEGAAEIEVRVSEITAQMIDERAKILGQSLVQQLGTATQEELDGLKRSIVSILENNADSPDKVEGEVTAAVRKAGLIIKGKAQQIRDWRRGYENEMEVAVTSAAQEHFSIIAHIRDLALQKIGMKWAWMDGITYKDWQKYHQLKARFEQSTEDLKRLITSHPGLMEAHSVGTEVEGQAMGIAQTAAAELARLKEVAMWKSVAKDYTDDFDSDVMRLAAEAVQNQAAEAAASASSAVHSGVDEVTEGAASAGEALRNGASKVLSPESQEQETVVVSMSSVDPEDTETSVVPPLESLTAEPTESASNLASDSVGSETPTSVAESTSGTAEALEAAATPDPVDGPEQMEEVIVETPDVATSVDEAAATPVKSALFGAAAQSVPSRQPIMDDDFSDSASSAFSVVQSDIPASITSAAQAAYTAAIAGAADQYARAAAAVSTQIHGEPKPAHEELLSSVSGAYFGAVASAQSQLDSAMSAASEGIYGTPTTKWMPEMPTMPSVEWEKIQSIAQQNLRDSVDWASEQYEAAKVAVGAAEPTPSSYMEAAEKKASKLLDQAQHNYFAGLGMAHARYSEFLTAASTAMSSLTATPTPTNIQETASSLASVASESAAAAASAAGESWDAATAAAGDSFGSAASAAGDSWVAATAAAGDSWDAIINRVSSQVYSAPTPTPWYENVYAVAGDYASAAGDYAASATDAAAEQVSAASSFAGDYASSAGDAASSQYSVVSSLVSELVVGKEPTFTESVYSRLAGAYGNGASSASSMASVASETIASAAAQVTDAAGAATDAVKETVQHIVDEL
ncbi:hypothetical protein GGR56DRAFT_251618 [Xylariaceae sp. FL0804]|nr:hypothetical protein GGR56DRAFT_251618 [Xylariaceae sp. FL0804]